MNQQEVMQKIKELAAQIEQSKHPVNTLEIAVLKAKCVDLYEHMQILVPDYTAAEVQIPAEEIKPLIEQQINAPEEATAPVETKEEPVIQSLLEMEELAEAFEEAPAKQEEVFKAAPEPHIEQPVLQNIFTQAEHQVKDEPSLHERLTKPGPKNDLNEKLQAKVESLKSAISLNKKIAFVNQLFNENTVEYAKAIDKLNSSNTLDESMRYFTELKHTLSWDNENELVKELQTLIEKRFA